MGVLNVGDHLKHRRRLQEENLEDLTWDDNPADEVPLEQTPVTTPKSSCRNRKPKAKHQYYYTPQKPKGARSGRRYENTCFLLSLVDHEEIGDLDVSDFVHTTMTIFASLLNNPNHMQIWNEFANLPEEEQHSYLEKCRSNVSKAEQEAADARVTTTEDREPVEEDLFAVADESFLKIDKRLRGTLRKRRFPVGSLKEVEEDVMAWFSSSPDAVMVSILPSSLDRLLTHAVCQYLNLISNSINCHGTRLVEMESRHNTFMSHHLTLSQYLERKIFR